MAELIELADKTLKNSEANPIQIDSIDNEDEICQRGPLHEDGEDAEKGDDHQDRYHPPGPFFPDEEPKLAEEADDKPGSAHWIPSRATNRSGQCWHGSSKLAIRPSLQVAKCPKLLLKLRPQVRFAAGRRYRARVP